MSAPEPIIADPNPPTPDPAAPPDAPAVPDSAPATPPTPAPASWRSALSPDLQNNPTLERIETIEDLAKEHVNVRKLIGADKIAKPQADWTPEQFEQFYTQLGRPADPKDYDLSNVKVPENLPVDEDFQTTMIEKLHARGASQELVSGLLEDYYSIVGEQHQAVMGELENQRAEGIKNLRNEWGKSFDSQIDLAKRAFSAATGENFESVAAMTLADGGKLGDHPAIIKAFAALGGKMNEHGLVAGSMSRSALSPVEAVNEKNKLYNDEHFMKALLDENNPEHSSAVKRIHDLTVAEVGSAP